MKRSVRFSDRWMMLAIATLLGANSASSAPAQQSSTVNPLRTSRAASARQVQPAGAIGSAVRAEAKTSPQHVSHEETAGPARGARRRSSGISTAAYRQHGGASHRGFTPMHEQYSGGGEFSGSFQTGTVRSGTVRNSTDLKGSVLNGTVTVPSEPHDVVDGGVYYENGAEAMMDEFEMGDGCNDCGDDSCDQCCLIPCPRINWDDLTIFGGVQGFTGPKNLGGSGSFGFHEGLNWGAPFPFFDGCLGVQAGARFTQANLSGSQNSPDTRHQVFLTGGIFRRVDWGLQGGVAFDYLADTWYTNTRLAQLRVEISWVFPCGHELGFWGAKSLNEDTEPTQIFNPIPVIGNGTWQTTDLYAFFYRHRFSRWEGANCRLYAGFTGDSDGYIGSDVQVPLSCDLALQAGFAYLVPEQTKGPAGIGNQEESWNVGISLVWYPGSGSAVNKSYFAPLFNVADNGSFMVDRVQ